MKSELNISRAENGGRFTPLHLTTCSSWLHLALPAGIPLTWMYRRIYRRKVEAIQRLVRIYLAQGEPKKATERLFQHPNYLREAPVTMLVLLAGTAGAGFIATDFAVLSHNRPLYVDNFCFLRACLALLDRRV